MLTKITTTKIPATSFTVADALAIAVISLAAAYAVNRFAPAAVKNAIKA